MDIFFISTGGTTITLSDDNGGQFRLQIQLFLQQEPLLQQVLLHLRGHLHQNKPLAD